MFRVLASNGMNGLRVNMKELCYFNFAFSLARAVLISRQQNIGMHDGFCRGGTLGNDLEQGLPLLEQCPNRELGCWIGNIIGSCIERELPAHLPHYYPAFNISKPFRIMVSR